MTTPRTGDQRAALGPAVLVALTSTVAVVALSQRWWWALGAATALTVVLLVAVLRGLHAGRLSRPSSRRVETVRRWLMMWPFGMIFPVAALWPEADRPGSSMAVVAVLVVLGATAAAFQATQTHWAADDAGAARAHRLPWRRRLQLARAIRSGAPLAATSDRDVRAVAHRMTEWEVVGAMSVVLALVLGGLAVILLVDREQDAPLFVALAAGLGAVAVHVLRGSSAALRRRAEIERRGPGVSPADRAPRGR